MDLLVYNLVLVLVVVGNTQALLFEWTGEFLDVIRVSVDFRRAVMGAIRCMDVSWSCTHNSRAKLVVKRIMEHWLVVLYLQLGSEEAFILVHGFINVLLVAEHNSLILCVRYVFESHFTGPLFFRRAVEVSARRDGAYVVVQFQWSLF
jgi:hypothetical protein